MLLSTQSLDASVHEICLVDSDWYGLLGGGNGSGSGVQLLDEYLSGDIPSTGMFLSTWVVGINHLKRNLEHYWDWIRRHPEFDIKIIVLGPDRIDKAELRPLPEEYIHLILPKNDCGRSCRNSTDRPLLPDPRRTRPRERNDRRWSDRAVRWR